MYIYDVTGNFEKQGDNFFFNFDRKGPPLQYEGKIIISESINDLNNINVH